MQDDCFCLNEALEPNHTDIRHLLDDCVWSGDEITMYVDDCSKCGRDTMFEYVFTGEWYTPDGAELHPDCDCISQISSNPTTLRFKRRGHLVARFNSCPHCGSPVVLEYEYSDRSLQ